MFTLTIKTVNDAFQDDAALEVARILRDVAGKLEQGRDCGKTKDINGNTVGEWDFEEDYERIEIEND